MKKSNIKLTPKEKKAKAWAEEVVKRVKKSKKKK